MVVWLKAVLLMLWKLNHVKKDQLSIRSVLSAITITIVGNFHGFMKTKNASTI